MSAPQPIGALVAYALVKQVESLLPFSFAFAAGAMLALVIVELIPHAVRQGSLPMAVAGTAGGGSLMIVVEIRVGPTVEQRRARVADGPERSSR